MTQMPMDPERSPRVPSPSAPLPSVRRAVMWVSIRRWVTLGVSAALSILAVWWLLEHGGLPRQAAFMGGIFVLAALLWVTEVLPLFATSLLVIGLQAVLLANPGDWPGLGFEGDTPSPSFNQILSVLADPVLVLFFGGFVLARAATAQGVDQAISVLLLRPFGTQPRGVLLGVMMVTLGFGVWMSNTATAAMMLAIVTPLLATMPPGEPFRKAIVLAIPLTANLSGMGTPIASPPNAVAVSFLRSEGYAIPFLKWMLVATPLMVVLALLTWVILWKAFPPQTQDLRLTHIPRKLSKRGWFVVVIFGLTVVLWMTDTVHGLPAAAVALLPVVAFTTTGVFTRRDLEQIDWSVLILIAGGIALGSGMQLTGLDRVIVQWLPIGEGGGGWLLLTALVLGTVIVGTFMSNTAAANLFLPIGISASSLSLVAANNGAGTGLHPVQAAMSIALVASLSMALPISTPPNAMAYSRGEFTTGDMVRVTLVISGVGVAAIILGGGVIMRLCGVI